MKAVYVQQGEYIDYTPSSAVNAGDIVFFGKMCGIAKLDIPANELGALAIKGVFKIAKASGAVTLGAKLYWDAENSKVKTTATDKYVGTAIAASASGDSYAYVLINEGESEYVAPVV